MFNHHFFGGQEEHGGFDKFVADGRAGKMVILVDPPFGGMVEALGSTVQTLVDQCKHGKKILYLMFYLIGRKEENVLFNDALNIFYLRLYGIRHMVKDHSDSERGNLLLPHGLLFPINSKGSFICTFPQTG